ncbi:MAG TPA: hypothetical protein VGM88_05290 [Kofleriaceae bacterium]
MCLLLAATGGVARAEDPSITVSGFARLDFFVNDSAMADVDAGGANVVRSTFVLPEPTGGRLDGATALTPRFSRIALNLEPFDLGYRNSVEAIVEADFAGGTGTNALRLRQAAATIHVGRMFSLTAGQTADLMSPLIPSAQEDTQLLYAGNVGDRRPQLQMAVAVAHTTMAVSFAADGWLGPGGTAAADGTLGDGTHAMLQWLLDTHFRLPGNKDWRIGVSGHVERESASINAHAFLNVTRHAALIGETYIGTNLTDIGGGVANLRVPGQTVHGAGGWGEFAYLPDDKHLLALGASVDSAQAKDVADGDRTLNRTVYAVVHYKPVDLLQFGLEYLAWRTDYRDAGHGVANRFDLSLSLFF